MREETRRRAKNLRAEPTAAEEPAALLELGRRLQRLQDLSAPARLREEALARALAAPIPNRRRVIPLRARPAEWAVVVARLAASALVAFGTAYGTVAVSAASLPNSPLYPVKLFVEDIRVAVAPIDQRPDLYVELAVRRVEETETLLQTGRIVEAERAVESANRQIAAARAAADQRSRVGPSNEVLASTSERVQKVTEALTHRGGTSPAILPEPGPSGRPAPSTGSDGRVGRPGDPSGPTGSAAIGVQPPVDAIVPSGPADDQVTRGGVSAPGASEAGLVRPGTGFVVIESGDPARVQPMPTPAQLVAPIATFERLDPAGSGAARTEATATRTATPTETTVPRVPPGPPGSSAPGADGSSIIIIPGRPSPQPPR